MDGEDGDADAHEEVDCDPGLIHGASGSSEEDVHQDGHDDGSDVHEASRPDQQDTP